MDVVHLSNLDILSFINLDTNAPIDFSNDFTATPMPPARMCIMPNRVSTIINNNFNTLQYSYKYFYKTDDSAWKQVDSVLSSLITETEKYVNENNVRDTISKYIIVKHTGNNRALPPGTLGTYLFRNANESDTMFEDQTGNTNVHFIHTTDYFFYTDTSDDALNGVAFITTLKNSSSYKNSFVMINDSEKYVIARCTIK